MKRTALFALALIATPVAWPDAITINGVRHEGVFVLETERLVYVHFPEEGRVQALVRAELSENAIELLEDAAAREAIRAAWQMTRDAHALSGQALAHARGLQRPHAQVIFPDAQRMPADAGETIERMAERPLTDGVVPYISLRDVPLRTALSALLRPMGLGYEVRDGILFISDPETLRTELWESLETRVYDIKAFDTTLPKLIVTNPGGQRSGPIPIGGRQGSPGGFGPAFQGQQGFQGPAAQGGLPGGFVESGQTPLFPAGAGLLR